MTRTLILALVAVGFAVNAAGAFAQGGSHVMWTAPYKSTAYGVWHDNATCTNPPRR